MKRFIIILVFALLFLPAALIMHSHFTPEPRPQDHCPLLLMNTLNIWNQSNPIHYYYSPVQTHTKPGDKGVTDYKRLEDAKGNNYYVSHPPFVFMLSWGLTRMIHLKVTYSFFQWTGLVLLLIASFFISAMAGIYVHRKNKIKEKYSFQLSLSTLTSFLVYALMPVMLYMHTFSFFSELLGQFFWAALLILILRFYDSANKRLLPAIGLCAFFLIYSDWTGILYIVPIFIAFFKFRKKNEIKKLFLSVLLGSVAALLFSIAQYSAIAGMKPFFHALLLRYSERSGIFGESYSAQGIHLFSVDSWLYFFRNLHSALLGFGYIILFLCFLSLLMYRQRIIKIKLSADLKIILLLTIIPVLLRVILLFNASATHKLYLSGIAVPIATIAGIAAYNLQSINQYKRAISFLLIVLFAFGSFISVSVFNDTYAKSYSCDNTKDAAGFIRKEAHFEEVIFIKNESACPLPLPYLTWACDRNMMPVKDSIQAKKILTEMKKDSAVLFILQDNPAKNIVQHIICKP
ncbi:MAG: hypothetical protein V2A54_07030 [Bacteroidota bacterium]